MPCAALPQGQTNAGHKKAAQEEPHPLPDVVSSTDKIISSYIKDAVLVLRVFFHRVTS